MIRIGMLRVISNAQREVFLPLDVRSVAFLPGFRAGRRRDR